MTRQEAKKRAENSAKKIMDYLIHKVVLYIDKNKIRINKAEELFGFPNGNLQRIIDKERSYEDPKLITVLQIISGLGLNAEDMKDLFELININHPAPNAIVLPEKFKYMSDGDKAFLINMINQYVEHAISKPHLGGP